MSIPNPVDPEDHGEELLGGQTARDAEILAALSADLEGSEVEKLAAQLVVPVVPDGGSIGRTVAPHVARFTKVRDLARIWGPAVATTGAAGVAVTVLPLPGPLSLYVLALAAFAWWHCAGRPGAVDTVRMLAHAIGDAGSWVRRQVEALAVIGARHGQRRAADKNVRPTTEKKEK